MSSSATLKLHRLIKIVKPDFVQPQFQALFPKDCPINEDPQLGFLLIYGPQFHLRCTITQFGCSLDRIQ
jgi:hypothetical protein